jgi:lipoyl(octanoyl) transferase
MRQAESESFSQELWVCQLGTIPYSEALELQLQVRERRLAGELPDTLLLLEHPPVYTRGRRSRPEELALGEEYYRARGIDIVDTDRGGRVTYHGPGQLVGYPIVGVSDIGAHLRAIETAIVATLADNGIDAWSRCAEGPDYTGVWVEDRKIASIGVHVSRGIATHGFAINVTNDLAPFSWVIACGLPDVRMTSVTEELPATASAAQTHTIDPATFAEAIADSFCRVHARRQRQVGPERLTGHADNTDAPAGAQALAAV